MDWTYFVIASEPEALEMSICKDSKPLYIWMLIMSLSCHSSYVTPVQPGQHPVPGPLMASGRPAEHLWDANFGSNGPMVGQYFAELCRARSSTSCYIPKCGHTSKQNVGNPETTCKTEAARQIDTGSNMIKQPEPITAISLQSGFRSFLSSQHGVGQ